jgi:hypothetical protein
MFFLCSGEYHYVQTGSFRALKLFWEKTKKLQGINSNFAQKLEVMCSTCGCGGGQDEAKIYRPGAMSGLII